MKKIYQYQGGKHRNTTAARTWRSLTGDFTKVIRTARPEMSFDVAALYAESAAARLIRTGHIVLVPADL